MSNRERITAILDCIQLAEDSLMKAHEGVPPEQIFNVQIALTALRQASASCQSLERSLAGVPEPKIGQ